MVRYPPVTDAHDIDGFELNGAVGRRDAQQRTVMRAVIGLEGRHAFTISKLPMNLGVEIGECFTEVGVELSHASLVGRCSWLRRVIDEVVGKQFVEDVERAVALHFLGVTTHDSLDRKSTRLNSSHLGISYAV